MSLVCFLSLLAYYFVSSGILELSLPWDTKAFLQHYSPHQLCTNPQMQLHPCVDKLSLNWRSLLICCQLPIVGGLTTSCLEIVDWLWLRASLVEWQRQLVMIPTRTAIGF
jgi:hypothetical protein